MGVAELVYAEDLKSSAERIEGSNPFTRTKLLKFSTFLLIRANEEKKA